MTLEEALQIGRGMATTPLTLAERAAARLTAEVSRLSSPAWQGMESALIDGTVFLAVKAGAEPDYDIVCYHTMRDGSLMLGCNSDGSSSPPFKPTHWMLLPLPPQEEPKVRQQGAQATEEAGT